MVGVNLNKSYLLLYGAIRFTMRLLLRLSLSACHMNPTQATNQRAALFGDVNFRWLLGGALLSLLGEQLALISFPWLVLKMTGDPFALGTVLALIGVPRALLMLVSGALVDRYSPKKVLMLMKYINTVLLGTLALLVLTNSLALWMVYGLALAIGIVTAFSIPSETAILPHVINDDRLPLANSAMLGLRQVTMFIGPLLAGFLIAHFNDTASAAATDTKGVGVAFLLNAIGYAISAWSLTKVMTKGSANAEAANNAQKLFKSVAAGFAFCWDDVILRSCFLYWGAVALFISGPLQVAMPILADQLHDGVAAYGILMGTYGAGMLLGMVISGIKPHLRLVNLGLTILLADVLIGMLTMLMGYIQMTWQGALCLMTAGTFTGFIQVAVFTWIQRRVPANMMGRAMGLFMLVFVGVAPVSAAVTGWLMRSMTVGQLFVGSGALLIFIACVALAMSPIRAVSDAH